MPSFTTIVATLLTAIVAVEAGPQHIPMGNYARHAAVVRRNPVPVTSPVEAPTWSSSRRGLNRRCKSKPKPSSQPSTQPNTPSQPSNPAPATGGNGGSNGNNGGSGGSGGGNNGAMINFQSNDCPVNAAGSPGNDAGPNGSEDFMNCGLNQGGWRPPAVKLSDIVYHPSLRSAVNEPGSPFGACAGLIDAFEQAANDNGVPAILLASLAMQESSCNPSVTGGAGEIGLMQITPDKCGPGNCYDAYTNLSIGARYFKTVLDSHGGNVFQAAGEYNGWFPGMNPGDVLGRPCPQQQNFDYLHQLFNHWMQNRDPAGAGNQRNKQACGGY